MPSAKVEDAKIEIYDLNGRKLLEKQIPAGRETIEIDVSHLKSGVYFCRLISENKSATQKLIHSKISSHEKTNDPSNLLTVHTITLHLLSNTAGQTSVPTCLNMLIIMIFILLVKKFGLLAGMMGYFTRPTVAKLFKSKHSLKTQGYLPLFS